MGESDAATALKQTPIASVHTALGARMVPFAGYAMPLQYAGILKEHAATREAAGIFDVSHMGQVTLRGDAEAVAAWLERLSPSLFRSLGLGRARYSVLTNDDGGIVDDFIALRLADRFALVVNGARRDAVAAHFSAHAAGDIDVAFEDRALIAVQGPSAQTVLSRHADGLDDLAFMEGRDGTAFGSSAVITRSGYTGEDGFEVSLPREVAANAFAALAEAATPAGLGARDVLRLEAGLSLYGQDLSEEVSPVEAGLAFTVAKARREEGGFLGAQRILRELTEGPSRQRVGLLVDGRVPARAGAPIERAGQVVGVVTSGAHSPSLNRPIAMGLVGRDHAAPGTTLAAIVRDRRIAAEVSPVPFLPPRTRRRGTPA